jgi:hypothetical protein
LFVLYQKEAYYFIYRAKPDAINKGVIAFVDMLKPDQSQYPWKENCKCKKGNDVEIHYPNIAIFMDLTEKWYHKLEDMLSRLLQ